MKLNLHKSKHVAKFFTLLTVFTLITCIFPNKSFASTNDNYLKDSNGDLLKTGKNYYISLDTFPNRALTYEVYNNWDYVLAHNEASDGKLHGTPIKLYIEDTNNESGLNITKDDSVIFEMTNQHWYGYKYFKFDKTGGYIWLDTTGSPITLEQDNYQDGIALNAGGEVTKYYDAFGQICDSSSYDHKITDETYVYLFNSNQVFSNPNKLWASIYMRRHYTINGTQMLENVPKYYFIPAN